MKPALTATRKHQSGMVLVIGLIFLLVLTLVAVVATQSTTMEERMSANDTFKARATESSESLRTAADNILDTTMFNHGGWPTTVNDGTHAAGTLNTALFTIPNGVSITWASNWGTGNEAGETVFTPSTLQRDMSLRVDGDNDGNFTGPLDQSADLYVYKTIVTLAPGSSTAMVAGYEGTGKSTASGGAFTFFDMRSVGTSASNANAITYSNYRYVVR